MELSDITKDILENFVNRKNKLAIVKFSEDNCLIFLVEDKDKPEIPGYPANGLTYFHSRALAIQAIKDCYKRCKYTPRYAEFGSWSR